MSIFSQGYRSRAREARRLSSMTTLTTAFTKRASPLVKVRTKFPAGDCSTRSIELEKRLTKRRYLFDKRIVEADWRLFCTLVRFDAVYHGHFKCNIRRIVDYPNLQGYLLDLYQQPGIAERSISITSSATTT